MKRFQSRHSPIQYPLAQPMSGSRTPNPHPRYKSPTCSKAFERHSARRPRSHMNPPEELSIHRRMEKKSFFGWIGQLSGVSQEFKRESGRLIQKIKTKSCGLAGPHSKMQSSLPDSQVHTVLARPLTEGSSRRLQNKEKMPKYSRLDNTLIFGHKP